MTNQDECRGWGADPFLGTTGRGDGINQICQEPGCRFDVQPAGLEPVILWRDSRCIGEHDLLAGYGSRYKRLNSKGGEHPTRW